MSVKTTACKLFGKLLSFQKIYPVQIFLIENLTKKKGSQAKVVTAMYLKVRKVLFGQITSEGRDNNSIVKLLELWKTSLSTILANILL
jgi:hypothetical protein